MLKEVKYHKNFCKKIVEHCKKGGDIRSFCSKINVCSEQLVAWYFQHDEFRHACKVARDSHYGWWEKVSRVRAVKDKSFLGIEKNMEKRGFWRNAETPLPAIEEEMARGLLPKPKEENVNHIVIEIDE